MQMVLLCFYYAEATFTASAVERKLSVVACTHTSNFSDIEPLTASSMWVTGLDRLRSNSNHISPTSIAGVNKDAVLGCPQWAKIYSLRPPKVPIFEFRNLFFSKLKSLHSLPTFTKKT